jgi:hypothetical protein
VLWDIEDFGDACTSERLVTQTFRHETFFDETFSTVGPLMSGSFRDGSLHDGSNFMMRHSLWEACMCIVQCICYKD